jgi:hypothetical protein
MPAGYDLVHVQRPRPRPGSYVREPQRYEDRSLVRRDAQPVARRDDFYRDRFERRDERSYEAPPRRHGGLPVMDLRHSTPSDWSRRERRMEAERRDRRHPHQDGIDRLADSAERALKRYVRRALDIADYILDHAGDLARLALGSETVRGLLKAALTRKFGSAGETAVDLLPRLLSRS